MKTVSKGWGYELWIENNQLYCGKHLHVLPYKQCSVHYHKNKTETFYVISGELLLTYCESIENVPEDQLFYYWVHKADIKSVILTRGDNINISPYVPHKFTSNKHYACDFIEFSTFHEDSDSYRIIKGD